MFSINVSLCAVVVRVRSPAAHGHSRELSGTWRDQGTCSSDPPCVGRRAAGGKGGGGSRVSHSVCLRRSVLPSLAGCPCLLVCTCMEPCTDACA
jgi:hypothetical protein